jgi:hypothetical protein
LEQLLAVRGGFGFTVPANVVAYGVGEATGSKNFIDLKSVPKDVTLMVKTLARNTAHLAELLKAINIPGRMARYSHTRVLRGMTRTTMRPG